jgi:hypothetical protein
MPELDYVVLADYVRQDAGTTHIMGAGIDTFTMPASVLPAAVPVGLAVRIMFTSRDTVGQEHSINLTFSLRTEDDQAPEQPLMTATQRFPTPAAPPGVPAHWRTAVGIVIRFAVPIPQHGDYALDLTIDDDPRLSRRLDLRAVEPAR